MELFVRHDRHTLEWKVRLGEMTQEEVKLISILLATIIRSPETSPDGERKSLSGDRMMPDCLY